MPLFCKTLFTNLADEQATVHTLKKSWETKLEETYKTLYEKLGPDGLPLYDGEKFLDWSGITSATNKAIGIDRPLINLENNDTTTETTPATDPTSTETSETTKIVEPTENNTDEATKEETETTETTTTETT